MGHEYLNRVKDVQVDKITIGFIARRSTVVGFAQEIPDGWMITKEIFNPQWSGNYETRAEARKALLALQYQLISKNR